jgi:hypothetical protein
MDVLAIRDEGSIEKNACTFEHILSPGVTDRTCTFLGHPRTVHMAVRFRRGMELSRGNSCRRKLIYSGATVSHYCAIYIADGWEIWR